MKKIQLFHLGPPKTATTWLYRCLREHPQISAPPRDTIHYFDIHYARGHDWYESQFDREDAGRIRFDPTPSYVCSPRAPERIAAYNPAARLIVCLRHPVERAFSHYWHLKKNDLVRKEFSDVLEHYDSFATWVEHGFVAIGLERILHRFDRDQLLVLDFRALNEDPDAEFVKILRFAGVDEEFRPSELHRKVNVAGPRNRLVERVRSKMTRVLFGRSKVDDAAGSPLFRWLSGKSEYLRGPDPHVYEEIMKIAEPEIERIEALLGIELDHWRT